MKSSKLKKAGGNKENVSQKKGVFSILTYAMSQIPPASSISTPSSAAVWEPASIHVSELTSTVIIEPHSAVSPPILGQNQDIWQSAHHHPITSLKPLQHSEEPYDDQVDDSDDKIDHVEDPAPLKHYPFPPT